MNIHAVFFLFQLPRDEQWTRRKKSGTVWSFFISAWRTHRILNMYREKRLNVNFYSPHWSQRLIFCFNSVSYSIYLPDDKTLRISARMMLSPDLETFKRYESTEHDNTFSLSAPNGKYLFITSKSSEVMTVKKRYELFIVMNNIISFIVGLQMLA